MSASQETRRAEEDHRAARTARVSRHGFGILFLVAAIAFCAWARIHTALDDPNFDTHSALGMLKSDPGLLYYFTGRIIDAGGIPPADFRADPRVEYPGITDIPALFPVGQEFVVAWLYRLMGGDMPLHVFCVWVMGVFASLCAIGVYGLALELTGGVVWACLAAGAYSIMPANYRTIGFILVGEDFSVPWFALHLYLAVRAARIRSGSSVLLAAISLAIAVSTWHAMSFFVALEAFVIFAWFVRSGDNPFECASAWLLPATLATLSLIVPILKSTMFAASLPMQMALALCAAGLWRARMKGCHRAALAVALVAWAVLLFLSVHLSRWLGGGIGEYSHVFGLLWQKVVNLGQLPSDPRELPFEVRLMWQGPFATMDPWAGVKRLGIPALFLVPAGVWMLRGWRRAQTEPCHHLLYCLTWLSLPIAYLIERTSILPALLCPVVAVCASQRLGAQASGARKPQIAPWIAPSALGAALVVQGGFFLDHIGAHLAAWYLPPQRQTEIAGLIGRIPEIVPEGAAIAADFMNSTAILAHTGHPILLQPKYESRSSRERAQEFLMTFFHGTPEEMRLLLTVKYKCRFVLFDRFTLGWLSRYTAGIPPGQRDPTPGTAAAVFLSQDGSSLKSVPGYKLLYRSPATILQSDGSPTDFFRLYEIEP